MIIGYALKSTLFYKVQQDDNPSDCNHRNPRGKIFFSSLVVHRPSHPQPDTEYSSQESEYPERLFRYPPPLIERLELVDTHHQIGKDIDTTENREYEMIHNL